MSHRYATGQTVMIANARAIGPCRVVMQMPLEDGRQRYRVQSFTEQHQRVVLEDDLSLSEAVEAEAEAETADVFSIAIARR
jgi:hypothetical protein